MLIERQQRLEERQQRLEEKIEENRRVLIIALDRYGVISERTFREGMKAVIEKILGVRTVKRELLQDKKGEVYGTPSTIEIDVVVENREHILVEVKSRVKARDVYELYRIGRFYAKEKSVNVRLVMLGGFVDKKAREVARKIGVEIRPLLEDNEHIETL